MNYINLKSSRALPNSLILFVLFILSCSSSAYSIWEANIAGFFKGDPDFDKNKDMYGGRLSATNFFYNYKNYLELGIDSSIAYAKTSKKKYKSDFSKDIYIASVAFLFRLQTKPLVNYNNLAFFLEGGVGPSYMSNDNFEGKRLGMKFAFQDIGGLGLKMDYGNNQFLAGIYIIHYSNAGLSSDNRGITLPLTLRLGYRF